MYAGSLHVDHIFMGYKIDSLTNRQLVKIFFDAGYVLQILWCLHSINAFTYTHGYSYLFADDRR